MVCASPVLMLTSFLVLCSIEDTTSFVCDSAALDNSISKHAELTADKSLESSPPTAGRRIQKRLPSSY